MAEPPGVGDPHGEALHGLLLSPWDLTRPGINSGLSVIVVIQDDDKVRKRKRHMT